MKPLAERSEGYFFLLGMGGAINVSGGTYFPSYEDYFPEAVARARRDGLEYDLDWYIVGSYIADACKDLAAQEHLDCPSESQLSLPL